MSDTKHLELRRRVWWYVRAIPKALAGDMPEPYTGKAHVKINLHTADLREAHLRRLTANATFETALAEAHRRHEGGAQANAMAKAEAWHVAVKQHGGMFYDEIRAEAAQIEQEHGGDLAQAFYAKAVGTPLTLIDAHLDAYIAHKKISPKFVAETRRAVGRFKDWRSALSVEKTSLAVVREYVEQDLSPGRASGTVNKALTALSGYWAWMIKRGLVSGVEDHWPKFRPKAEPRRPGERERAFTDDEIVTLFKTPMRKDVNDAALIGALTGARLEEIARVKVRDVHLDTMMVYLAGTKTEAAERTIPIHSGLRAVLARRIKGKRPGDWLFDELPERKAGDQKGRSSPISTGFTRHRRAVGVDAVVEGKRRALTNFHSFRRWFITKAERAGKPPHVIEFIVGHKRQGQSLGVYSLGPDAETQMRDTIEAVHMPRLNRRKNVRR